jgi:hypothetical protein
MEVVNNVSATIFWDCILFPESGDAKCMLHRLAHRLEHNPVNIPEKQLESPPRKDMSGYPNWVSES